jgi:hypothetical protein
VAITSPSPTIEPAAPESSVAAPKSRRAMLAGAIGGFAGLLAGRFAKPDRALASAGDPLIIGNSSNNAGSSNTILTTSSSVVAFELIQNGPGTALMG